MDPFANVPLKEAVRPFGEPLFYAQLESVIAARSDGAAILGDPGILNIGPQRLLQRHRGAVELGSRQIARRTDSAP